MPFDKIKIVISFYMAQDRPLFVVFLFIKQNFTIKTVDSIEGVHTTTKAQSLLR